MTPDQWQELSGMAVGLVITLWHRRKQNKDLVSEQKTENDNLASSIDKTLTTRVDRVEAIANNLESRIAIYSSELSHTNQMTKEMRQDVADLQASLPLVKDVLDKTLNFFVRQRAATLEEKPLHGGMTAIKTKKESDR